MGPKLLLVKAVASCTVYCSPSRGGGNIALSISWLQSSIAHSCCFRASCPCVRQRRKPTTEFAAGIVAICSDLLPPSPDPVSDATMGSLTWDIALM